MRHDGGDPPDSNEDRSKGGAGLHPNQVLRDGSAVAEAEVKLRREFKGLTVRDLLADQGLDEMLPGRVLSALENLKRNDLRAAERALPGDFGPVLKGPGSRPRRRRLARWIVLCALAAAFAIATMALL